MATYTNQNKTISTTTNTYNSSYAYNDSSVIYNGIVGYSPFSNLVKTSSTYSNLSKNSSTYTGGTKNISTFTNQAPSASTWANLSKN